jgi:putative exosortase-associated protein (TIGR04073 family)
LKSLVIMLCCAIACIQMVGRAQAGEKECVQKGEWINSNVYEDNAFVLAFDKLGRGVVNTAFGVVEIPKQIVKRALDTGCASGYISGLFVGTGYFVLREMAGIYEIVTFPIPIPEHYAPVIDPLLGYRPSDVE